MYFCGTVRRKERQGRAAATGETLYNKHCYSVSHGREARDDRCRLDSDTIGSRRLFQD